MQRGRDEGAPAHDALTWVPSALVCLIGDEGYGKARLFDLHQHSRDIPIGRAFVTAHPDLVPATSLADSSKFGHKFVKADFGILDEDFSLGIHGDAERCLFGLDRPRLGLR